MKKAIGFTPSKKTLRALRAGPEVVTKKSSVGLIDIYAPPIALLVKLGSIVVHIDEAGAAGGHEFDWVAIRSLLADREVQDWIEAMSAKGFLPVKRS